MLEPVDDGTTEPGRPPIGAPPIWNGEGAGASPMSGVTIVGGAISGGTCCGPVTCLTTQNTSPSSLKNAKQFNILNRFKISGSRYLGTVVEENSTTL
ncbi:hypothetical protein HanRHA438_Chr08g0334571 [Helianthus annuus]|nr:hypothetical protein HanRHA438_Chr08g0334571 [Helianthus annuus]